MKLSTKQLTVVQKAENIVTKQLAGQLHCPTLQQK